MAGKENFVIGWEKFGIQNYMNFCVIKNVFKTTKRWTGYWQRRKIDWKNRYLATYSHPHRELISRVLATFTWMSLLEIGCGPGANIYNIISHFKGKQIGGIDINEDAINLAKQTFNGAFLKVGNTEDIMMSDKSVDVVLSDMCLMYIRHPDKAIKEIMRVARTHIVFCELHSDSFYGKIKLLFKEGYCAHNYQKLLEKHGFYDIMIMKIPLECWPDGNPQKTYGYIIRAKVPKYKK